MEIIQMSILFSMENTQLIMEKLGGGGHFSMAACQVEEKTVKETIDKLEEAIDQYLDERG